MSLGSTRWIPIAERRQCCRCGTRRQRNIIPKERIQPMPEGDMCIRCFKGEPLGEERIYRYAKRKESILERIKRVTFQ